jgi:hypothetical protein
MSKTLVILALSAISGLSMMVAGSAGAQTADLGLDGVYDYVTLIPGGGESAFMRAQFKISGSKLTLLTPPSYTMDLAPGMQPDFQATLQKTPPPEFSFFKGQFQQPGDTIVSPFTLLRQTLSDQAPRISVFGVYENRPMKILDGFDKNQGVFFEAQAERLGAKPQPAPGKAAPVEVPAQPKEARPPPPETNPESCKIVVAPIK